MVIPDDLSEPDACGCRVPGSGAAGTRPGRTRYGGYLMSASV